MFRFSLRELVLLTLIVAMGIGWWLDRSYWKGEAETWFAREEIIRKRILDFDIGYTWPEGEWKP
jgi:hypothetical protein